MPFGAGYVCMHVGVFLKNIYDPECEFYFGYWLLNFRTKLWCRGLQYSSNHLWPLRVTWKYKILSKIKDLESKHSFSSTTLCISRHKQKEEIGEERAEVGRVSDKRRPDALQCRWAVVNFGLCWSARNQRRSNGKTLDLSRNVIYDRLLYRRLASVFQTLVWLYSSVLLSWIRQKRQF